MATNVKKKKKRSKAKKRQSPKKKAAKPAKRKAKKKTSIRDKIRYVGLDGRKFSKIKQEYHDLDYVDQLTDAEKDWMSRFMEEYLGARVKHKGKKIHKGLNSKAGRKKLFDANNARNRDMYSLARATGLFSEEMPGNAIEALQREHYDAQDIENRVIEEIDKKKSNSEETE